VGTVDDAIKRLTATLGPPTSTAPAGARWETQAETATVVRTKEGRVLYFYTPANQPETPLADPFDCVDASNKLIHAVFGDEMPEDEPKITGAMLKVGLSDPTKARSAHRYLVSVLAMLDQCAITATNANTAGTPDLLAAVKELQAKMQALIARFDAVAAQHERT
jgi:hypothetical protein